MATLPILAKLPILPILPILPLQVAFNKLGINIGVEEAEKLVARLDDDNSLDISFEEWRDYLLFHPSSNMGEIAEFWRRESYLNHRVDHGEDVGTPGMQVVPASLSSTSRRRDSTDVSLVHDGNLYVPGRHRQKFLAVTFTFQILLVARSFLPTKPSPPFSTALSLFLDLGLPNFIWKSISVHTGLEARLCPLPVVVVILLSAGARSELFFCPPVLAQQRIEFFLPCFLSFKAREGLRTRCGPVYPPPQLPPPQETCPTVCSPACGGGTCWRAASQGPSAGPAPRRWTG